MGTKCVKIIISLILRCLKKLSIYPWLYVSLQVALMVLYLSNHLSCEKNYYNFRCMHDKENYPRVMFWIGIQGHRVIKEVLKNYILFCFDFNILILRSCYFDCIILCANKFFIPITFNNPVKAYSSNKKKPVIIQTHTKQTVKSIFLIVFNQIFWGYVQIYK